MAETKNPEKVKVPFGKGFWIGNLVVDTLLLGLNTSAVVYLATQYKKGNIEPEGHFLTGAAVGLNTAAMMLDVGSIARDIKRIHQISKKEKETGCPVSANNYTLLITHHRPNDVVKSDVKQ